MSALHWICALTLALVCCLSAQPIKRDANEKAWAKDEMLRHLKSFRDVTKNNCPDDTRIYSPADIAPECLSSALDCIITERENLRFQCNLTKQNKDYNIYLNFYSGLDDAKTEATPSPSPSSSSCKACEAYTEKKVDEFLEDIKNLVELW